MSVGDFHKSNTRRENPRVVFCAKYYSLLEWDRSYLFKETVKNFLPENIPPPPLPNCCTKLKINALLSTELPAHRRREQGLAGKLLYVEAKQNVQTRPVDWQSKPSPGCFLRPQHDFFMLTSLCSLYDVPGLPLLPCCGFFGASPSRRSEIQLLIFTSACKQGLGSRCFTQTRSFSSFCGLLQNTWITQVTRGQSLGRINVVLLLPCRVRAKVGEKNTKCC